jgi:hypothetical protein
MTRKELVADSLVGWLAKCGLVFLPGPPPETEEGSLLLWTGGCDAVIAYRDPPSGVWIEATYRGAVVPSSKIVCWMRLPHPSIWPELTVEPTSLIPESDLYAAGMDVIARWNLERAQ